MSTDAQVLVLGGGISGCLVAAGLADQALRVAIVEQRPSLMMGASRWNDGKVHLGYTFTGSPSMRTTELMQDGSAAFVDGLERALGERVPAQWWASGVTYIVDNDTLVDAETLWRRAQQVARRHDERAKRDPGMRHYLAGQPPLERLDRLSAEGETRQRGVIAAWRTPERHISTRPVADQLAKATIARDVDVIHGEVVGVTAGSAGWQVALRDASTVRAPVVVNCLWENRVVIDQHVRRDDEPTSIRYKRALFGSAVGSLAGLSSSTRILGPYGDVVLYTNGDAYLSWYPAGLVARSDDGSPPSVPEPNTPTETEAILDGLGLPATVLDETGADWELQGGFVVAWGHGDIDREDSPLHERHRPAVLEVRPGFISVDTGKYTLAPLLAGRAVERALRACADVSHTAGQRNPVVARG
jgi:hypothetical protein